MRYAYVLTEWHRYARWSSTHKVVEVVGPLHELKIRLRPWALKAIRNDHLNDGEYSAHLVELDEKGRFDTYISLEIEDVFWFHEQEYVPAP